MLLEAKLQPRSSSCPGLGVWRKLLQRSKLMSYKSHCQPTSWHQASPTGHIHPLLDAIELLWKKLSLCPHCWLENFTLYYESVFNFFDSGLTRVFCLLKGTSFTPADPNAYLGKSFPLAASNVAGQEQKDKEHVRRRNENHWSCSSELETGFLFSYATATG